MIQEQLTAQLEGQTFAADRIFPMMAPPDVGLPYITFSVVSAIPETALEGGTEITNTRLQVDVYALTYAQAHTVAAQVDAALAAWTVPTVPLIRQDFYEADTKLFRVSMDFSVWHN